MFATVRMHWKDEPNKHLEDNVCLSEFDVDTDTLPFDDEILYYFRGVDDMVSAFDEDNKSFEFVVEEVIEYFSTF